MAMETFSLQVYDDDGNQSGEVDLAVQCSKCGGRGKVVDLDAETFATCEPCGSTGTRLNMMGWDLLRFVRLYAAHPDALLEYPESIYSN